MTRSRVSPITQHAEVTHPTNRPIKANSEVPDGHPLDMSDLQSFKQSFKGDLVTPSDPDYPAAIARWAANSQRNAQVVAFVKDAQDVAQAIKYARDNNLPVAIKCGGHSPGAASSTEGLVIDLSRHMNTVRIDPEQKLAYVGGGALWEQVDKAAIEHELATVAGTVNDVRPLPLSLISPQLIHSADWRCRVCATNAMFRVAISRLSHVASLWAAVTDTRVPLMASPSTILCRYVG